MNIEKGFICYQVDDKHKNGKQKAPSMKNCHYFNSREKVEGFMSCHQNEEWHITLAERIVD